MDDVTDSPSPGHRRGSPSRSPATRSAMLPTVVHSGPVKVENHGGHGAFRAADAEQWVSAHLQLDSAGGLHLYESERCTKKITSWYLGEESEVAPSEIRNNCLIVRHVRTVAAEDALQLPGLELLTEAEAEKADADAERAAHAAHVGGRTADGRTAIEFLTARFMSSLNWVKAIEHVLDDLIDTAWLASPVKTKRKTKTKSTTTKKKKKKKSKTKEELFDRRSSAPAALASPASYAKKPRGTHKKQRAQSVKRRSPRRLSKRLSKMSIAPAGGNDIFVQLMDKERGRKYYCNQRTREVTWSAPPAEAQLWVQYDDPSGTGSSKVYYGNAATGETSWLLPGTVALDATAMVLPAAKNAVEQVLGDGGRALVAAALSASASPRPSSSSSSSSLSLRVRRSSLRRRSLSSSSGSGVSASPRASPRRSSLARSSSGRARAGLHSMASRSAFDVLASPQSTAAAAAPAGHSRSASAPVRSTLAEGWTQYTDETSGRSYWANAQSGASQWDPPLAARGSGGASSGGVARAASLTRKPASLKARALTRGDSVWLGLDVDAVIDDDEVEDEISALVSVSDADDDESLETRLRRASALLSLSERGRALAAATLSGN